MKRIVLFLMFSAASPVIAGKAVLWLPSSNASLEEFLDKANGTDFRITVALSSNEGLSLDKIKQLEKNGRLEIANTPQGNPFISLMYYPKGVGVAYVNRMENNPYFFALRVSDARDRFIKSFSYAPQGLVLPYGDVSKDWLQLARTFGYKWLAAALPANSTDFAPVGVDSVTLVPFQLAVSSLEITASSSVFFVVDDTLNISSGSVDMLTDLFSQNNGPFITVSEAISAIKSTQTTIDNFSIIFPPWRTYSEYLLKEEQYGLLSILARVRNDIMAFLNVDSKKGSEIMERYCKAEKYIGTLPYLDDEASTEEEIRTALEETYQIMGRATPGFIYQSFSKISYDENTFKIVRTTESVIYSRVEISTGTDKTLISSFSISLAGDFIEFRLEPASPLKPGETFEIYIDINGRIGSGNIKLLGGKREKIINSNAWEYALAAENFMIQMYQSGYYNNIKLKAYPLNLSEGIFSFRVPVADLKGNYTNWNYFPLVYSKNPDKTWTLVDGAYSKMDLGYIYPVK